MDRSLKNALWGIGFGVSLFALLMNWNGFWHAAAAGLWAFRPLWMGCVLAFILNVPMEKIELFLRRHLCRRGAEKPARLRTASIFLTLLAVCAVFVLMCAMVIPQLVRSAQEILRQMNTVIPNLTALLQGQGISAEWLSALQNSLESSSLLETLNSGTAAVVTAVTGAVSSATGLLFDLLLALILAVYLLAGKEILGRQLGGLMRAYLPAGLCSKTLTAARTLQHTYASYLGGQCIEAVILGLLMLAAFLVFRLPYAGLIAVMSAVLSFIPYVGSFATCAVGAVLIFFIDPFQALVSIILYQVVQFCENQFIYPHVVGNAVGLPAIWTFVAVLVGGTLFGVLGMIFFIPLTAAVYLLLGAHVRQRIAKNAAAEAPALPAGAPAAPPPA